MRALGEAVKLDPAYAAAFVGLGDAHAGLGQKDAAKGAWQRALETLLGRRDMSLQADLEQRIREVRFLTQSMRFGRGCAPRGPEQGGSGVPSNDRASPGAGPLRGRESAAMLVVAMVAIGLSASVPYWNWHPDEATYVQVALESRERGQWLDATYFGEPNYFKPPLLYAAMRGSFALLGDSIFAARLPGLLCLFGCALLVFAWAGRRSGLTAGTVAATTMLLSPLALRFGHLAMMDVPLGLSFLLSGLVGRDAATQRGLRRCARLASSVALAFSLKGPAMFPLSVAAFVVEAGREGLKARWLAALGLGAAMGSVWVVSSAFPHGPLFFDAFFGRENLGKFAAPWSIQHVLWLVGAVAASGLCFRLWPLGFFDAARVPAFARRFPLLALAFYAMPSSTFPQYMMCAAPAIALGLGCSRRGCPRGSWRATSRSPPDSC